MIQVLARPDLLKRLIDIEELVTNGPLASLTEESEWVYDRLFKVLMALTAELDAQEKAQPDVVRDANKKIAGAARAMMQQLNGRPREKKP